ncbi:9708_t:CDS:1, partial [Racocetra persica]
LLYLVKIMEINELKTKINQLINHYTNKKQEATQIIQQLFTKLNSLKELEALEKLPPQFLTAYLLYRQAFYSNYQEEHLQQANFDREKYLERLEKEIELTAEIRKQDIIDDLLGLITNDQINIVELTTSINQTLKSRELENHEKN